MTQENSITMHPLTIKGWKQENDLVFVSLPQGKYEIDGKEIEVAYKRFNTEGEIIDLSCIDSIFRIIFSTKIDGYENVDNPNDKLSVKEFNQTYLKLLNEGTHNGYDDEDDEEINVWKSTSQRLQFENFKQLWKKVEVPVYSKQKVQIELVGEEPQNVDKFIVPIRKLTGDLTNTLYSYAQTLHLISLIKNAFISRGYVYLEGTKEPNRNVKSFVIPDKIDFIRFSNGNDSSTSYLTISIPEFKALEKYSPKMSGTFEEVKARFEFNKKFIEDNFSVYFAGKKSINEVGDATIREVMSSLYDIDRKVRAIESMKKSVPEHRAAINSVSKLIETIKSVIIKNENC